MTWKWKVLAPMIQCDPRETETFTLRGRCHDCAAGVLSKPESGFTLQKDGDEPLFWYCGYCGSNHVEILAADGTILADQGNLYDWR